MNLTELLEDYPYKFISGNLNIEITGLELDSRKIAPGNAFICINGARLDGHQYIQSAIDQGASCIILENLPADLNVDESVTVIQVEDTHDAAGNLAANFYGHPSDDLTIVAITGTKGKTTVTHMLKQVLEDNQIPTASIGTLGIIYNDVHLKPHNTTPDPITLQKSLKDILDSGITHVVMEASSQGFKLKRMNGITFDIGIFLNIDQDHIGQNEHENFEEYLDCKKEIFDQSQQVIVNSNDKLWSLLTPEQKSASITFSIGDTADYYATNITPYRMKEALGTRFKLNGKRNEELTLNVPADFNVSNALATIAAADQLGLDLNQTYKTLQSFQPEGRSELIRGALEYGRIVLVDFAHNKLSIESVLNGLRPYKPERLISMFGLHWNETLMRRYDQGYAAGKYSDYTILTSDHKGPVSFEEISQDVIKGLDESEGEYEVIEDRKQAIERTLELSNQDDIVVLFGMGNERSQIIDGVETPFSEEAIVLDYLRKKAQDN